MSMRKPVSTFPEISEPVLRFIGAQGKNKRVLPQQFGQDIPEDLSGMAAAGLPEIPDVSEVETVRHFTRLSRKNFGVDQGMYPLGSCTMKYNPKISEAIAQTVAWHHPADKFAMSNVLRAIAALKRYLLEICGMEGCSLWPAAGAHGELTGMLVIKKAIVSKGEKRSIVLIPDTAHGTNPSSCAIAGFQIKNIASGPKGYLEAKTLGEHLTPDVAALMITNPNTLGIFEQEIGEIADMLHANGSYLYMDGANMNAIMGIARPGDMGVDCMHINLHKTFSTPHGGGGPGAGPVLVSEELERFLPVPRIIHGPHRPFELSYDYPDSIGMVHSFLGNVGVLIKALVYIVSIGPGGICEVSRTAALNANYLKKRLSGIFDLPYDTPTLHEFVLSDKNQKDSHVTTMDMAKALMDYGFHPPTVYFPLVVPGAIMIEPTETEPLSELDRFADAMEEIAEIAGTDPESLHERPLMTPVARVDEVKAARSLILTWNEMESNSP